VNVLYVYKLKIVIGLSENDVVLIGECVALSEVVCIPKFKVSRIYFYKACLNGVL